MRIEEHYTDTAGFTDHVFGLMQLLGFRFAPRIRDLGDGAVGGQDHGTISFAPDINPALFTCQYSADTASMHLDLVA